MALWLLQPFLKFDRFQAAVHPKVPIGAAGSPWFGVRVAAPMACASQDIEAVAARPRIPRRPSRKPLTLLVTLFDALALPQAAGLPPGDSQTVLEPVLLGTWPVPWTVSVDLWSHEAG